MSYRILVTGSRAWWDYAELTRHLADAVEEHGGPGNVVIVHGACPHGADEMADRYARACAIKVRRHPANWTEHGKAAGFRRNEAMVNHGADLCLAFLMPCVKDDCRKPKPHDSHGATHCADFAEDNGIETRRYRP
jgi:hypothetical protein